MTRSFRRWKCPSLRTLAAAALLAALAARATPAAAQACCTGGALVSPVRLAPPEDYAIGLQTRARNDLGVFDPGGRYLAASTEQDLEQDLAASFRVARRAQMSVVLPYVETYRVESGVGTWGSGIGDVAVNARYDFKLAAEMTTWPGVAVMGGIVFPTGKSVGDGTNPAATDATGTGTTNATVGIGLEKVHGPLYAALNGWLTYSASHTVTPTSTTGPPPSPITTSFPLQLTLLAVGGYVFENEAAAALYANFLERGDTTNNGMTAGGSGLRLTTLGATGLWPLAVDWRLTGSLYSDILLASFGRNEQAGAGLTVSLVRAWR